MATPRRGAGGFPISSSPQSDPSDRHGAAETGLCGACTHHLVQTSAKGGTFHRCGLADVDDRFPRYPPIPVIRCAGFERADVKGGVDR